MLPLSVFFTGGGSFIVTASNVSGTDNGAASAGPVSGSGTNTQFTGNIGTTPVVWSHISTASGATPGINSATILNPIWSITVADATDSVSTWRVTATDTAGRIGTNTITVTLAWTDTT